MLIRIVCRLVSHGIVTSAISEHSSRIKTGLETLGLHGRAGLAPGLDHLQHLRPADARSLTPRSTKPIAVAQRHRSRGNRADLLQLEGGGHRRWFPARSSVPWNRPPLELSLQAREMCSGTASGWPNAEQRFAAGSLRRATGRAPLSGRRSRESPGRGDAGEALGADPRNDSFATSTTDSCMGPPRT